VLLLTGVTVTVPPDLTFDEGLTVQFKSVNTATEYVSTYCNRKGDSIVNLNVLRSTRCQRVLTNIRVTGNSNRVGSHYADKLPSCTRRVLPSNILMTSDAIAIREPELAEEMFRPVPTPAIFTCEASIVPPEI
jgi:hypothetical protein